MPMIKQPLTIEHALLGFLRQQPMYGYEIHQRLLENAELGLVWNIKQSLLYAYLNRLEDEGFIRSVTEDHRPTRKMLHLTEAGAAAFLQWVHNPVEHGRDFRLEFLAKIYFARRESLTAAQELIKRQRSASGRLLDDVRMAAESQSSTQSYDWLVLQYRIGQLDAALQWLDVCVEWLREQESREAETQRSR